MKNKKFISWTEAELNSSHLFEIIVPNNASVNPILFDKKPDKKFLLFMQKLEKKLENKIFETLHIPNKFFKN